MYSLLPSFLLHGHCELSKDSTEVNFMDKNTMQCWYASRKFDSLTMSGGLERLCSLDNTSRDCKSRLIYYHFSIIRDGFMLIWSFIHWALFDFIDVSGFEIIIIRTTKCKFCHHREPNCKIKLWHFFFLFEILHFLN